MEDLGKKILTSSSNRAKRPTKLGTVELAPGRKAGPKEENRVLSVIRMCVSL